MWTNILKKYSFSKHAAHYSIKLTNIWYKLFHFSRGLTTMLTKSTSQCGILRKSVTDPETENEKISKIKFRSPKYLYSIKHAILQELRHTRYTTGCGCRHLQSTRLLSLCAKHSSFYLERGKSFIFYFISCINFSTFVFVLI